MTDRHKGYVVTLEHDLRADDAEATVAAIRQLRGVLSVEPVLACADDHMNRERVRWELEQKLWAALREKDGKAR